MINFNQTKYFTFQINSDTSRFDIEFLDPRHQELETYLQSIKKSKDLKLCSIGDLCEVFGGKTPNEYVESGVPIIKLRNVTGRGINWDTDFVDDEFFQRNTELHIRRNDILLTSTGDGTIGRVDLYDKNENLIPDGHVTAIRIRNTKELFPYYLLSYLRSKLGQAQIERQTVGCTGQTELNDPDINKILIVYPKTISKQKEIIKPVVTTEKNALGKESAIRKNLEEIENTILKELDIRIKDQISKLYILQLSESSERIDFDFNDPFYDNYERSMRNGKYPLVELKDLVTFPFETTNPLAQPDRQFSYVDIGNIDTRWGNMTPEFLMGFEATSDRMRQIMRAGQILVSTTRPSRKAISIVPKELDGELCSTGFASLACNNVNTEYLFYILRSNLITHEFDKLSSGSSYPEINREFDLPRIKIPCPSTEKEQKRIVRRIKLLSKRAHKLNEEANIKWMKAREIFERFFIK